MGLENIMSEITDELEKLISTKTVIGEPVHAGDSIIIPVTKVSFGFATGGGEGKRHTSNDEEGFGGGGGAGAKIEPVAFIVVSNDNVRVMPISPRNEIGVILDSIPIIIDKIKGKNEKSEFDDIEDVKNVYNSKVENTYENVIIEEDTKSDYNNC